MYTSQEKISVIFVLDVKPKLMQLTKLFTKIIHREKIMQELKKKLKHQVQTFL